MSSRRMHCKRALGALLLGFAGSLLAQVPAAVPLLTQKQLAPAPAQAAPSSFPQLVGGMNFAVDFDGIRNTNVSAVDIISSEGKKGFKLRITKRWINTDWSDFYAWQQSGAKKTVVVSFLDTSMKNTVGKLTLHQALCTHWTLSFNAAEARIMEVIEVASESAELR